MEEDLKKIKEEFCAIQKGEIVQGHISCDFHPIHTINGLLKKHGIRVTSYLLDEHITRPQKDDKAIHSFCKVEFDFIRGIESHKEVAIGESFASPTTARDDAIDHAYKNACFKLFGEAVEDEEV